MKIGIDSRWLVSKEKAGLEIYLTYLITNLAKIDRENEYRLFFNFFDNSYKKTIEEFICFNNFSARIFPVPLSILNPFRIPVELLVGRVDVFHSPRHQFFSQWYGKSIITIHDLMFLDHPEFLKPEWIPPLKKEIAVAVKKADLIIAVSEFTKRRLIQKMGVDEAKIRVIYEGVREEFYPVSNEDVALLANVKNNIQSKYGLKKPYILWVSNIEPKKNVHRLIDAFCQIKRLIPKDYKLVLVGSNTSSSWYFNEVFQHVVQCGATDDIIFTGYVPDTDLRVLYSGAEIFVFPSFYEGFGIPPLEAMACGTPIVCSNSASLPEVVGDAAIQVSPHNTDELVKAIYSLLADEKLRKVFAQKAINQAKRFSWEKMARETLAVYEETYIPKTNFV